MSGSSVVATVVGGITSGGTSMGIATMGALGTTAGWVTGEHTEDTFAIASLDGPDLIRKDSLREVMLGVELPDLESFKLIVLGLGALPGPGLIGEAGGLDTERSRVPLDALFLSRES